MWDGKLLSVVTRPFRTYRFWQCYYFYAEVDVKNRLNASLPFANAQTFTVEDEHFWQHYLFSCPVRVTVRIWLILLWPLQLFKPRPAIGISRCFLTDARWCAAFFFSSQACLVIHQSPPHHWSFSQVFFWLHELLFQQLGLFCFELWNLKLIWKILSLLLSSENKSKRSNVLNAVLLGFLTAWVEAVKECSSLRSHVWLLDVCCCPPSWEPNKGFTTLCFCLRNWI